MENLGGSSAPFHGLVIADDHGYMDSKDYMTDICYVKVSFEQIAVMAYYIVSDF